GRGALVNFHEGTFAQKPYWVLNSALTWRSQDKRFEVIGWVHNLTNTYYKTQSFDLSRGDQLILDAYADPRTSGLTATIHFDAARLGVGCRAARVPGRPRSDGAEGGTEESSHASDPYRRRRRALGSDGRRELRRRPGHRALEGHPGARRPRGLDPRRP